jgi:hypothetical protein
MASTKSLPLRSELSNAMEKTMCDYSLAAYRTRPVQLGERYETHRFESYSIGFIAPGDPSTAVCIAYDMRLRLEGIPERVQRAKAVSANEDVTFIRLETGPHHDGVRFANSAEVSLQELGLGVTGYLHNTPLSSIWLPKTAERYSTTLGASAAALLFRFGRACDGPERVGLNDAACHECIEHAL